MSAKLICRWSAVSAAREVRDIRPGLAAMCAWLLFLERRPLAPAPASVRPTQTAAVPVGLH